MLEHCFAFFKKTVPKQSCIRKNSVLHFQFKVIILFLKLLNSLQIILLFINIHSKFIGGVNI